MTMSELSQINKCSATTSQKVRPKQVFLPKVKYEQKPRLKHFILFTDLSTVQNLTWEYS